MSPVRLSPARRFTTLVRPVTLGASLTAVLALTLTGCAGTSTTPTAPTSQGAQGGGSGAGTGGGQRQPGVSGKIAAVSGKTLQVQAADAQTAVTYTAKTTFTEVTKATADALATGLCVSVRSTETSASATDQVGAGSVTLSSAVDGACTAGFGGGGVRPSGAPSGMPSGAPSGAPSGMPTNGARAGMGGANGKVVSIDGATFVVESTRPDQSGASTTTKITVLTTDATTWEQVKMTTANAAVVGRCAVAMGETDDTGALTATSLRLSTAAADGSCSTGMRGGGQPPNGQAPGAANGGTTGNG